MINITVDGVAYPVPSSAADQNWAAKQIAFQQALAAALSQIQQAVTLLHTDVTPVGNGADDTEDDLMTYTLPAGTLSANGMGLRVTAWGTGANTNEQTTARMRIGGVLIAEMGLIASQANTWKITADILRVGATSLSASTLAANGLLPASLGTNQTYQSCNTPTVTLANAVIVKCTGQTDGTTANRVIQTGFSVELLNP